MSEGGEIKDWGDEPPEDAREIQDKDPQKPKTPQWAQPSYEAAQWMMATLSKNKAARTKAESVAPEGTSVQTPPTPKTSEVQTPPDPSLKTPK